MATSRITNTITGPTGTALSGVVVTARLMPSGGFRTADFSEVARLVQTTTDVTGFWSLQLEENASITPSNSWYEVTELIPDVSGGKRVWQIAVGASDQSLLASLVTPAEQQPTVVPAGTVYLDQASADARYQALSSLGAATPVAVDAAAGTAGVATSASRSDHDHQATTGTPVATGDANADGTASSLARSDHVHKGIVNNDAWTAYTPTLTQSATVTKTVSYAKYQRTGRMITVQCDLSVTGAGTAANAVRIGLPFAAAYASNIVCGSGNIFDASAVTDFAGIARIATTTTVELTPCSTDGAGNLGARVFTAALASPDSVQLFVTYEAAT